VDLFWCAGVGGGYSRGEYWISNQAELQTHQRRKSSTKITGEWLSDPEEVDCEASPTAPALGSPQWWHSCS